MNTIKERVQEVVNQIYKNNGEVRPSILIEIARPKGSLAHDAFEWDNRKAGDEYRLMQARQWIRKVEIIIEEQPERLIHVPIIMNCDNNETHENTQEGYYKPVSIVLQDKSEFDAALNETLTKLIAAKSAYNVLKSAAKSEKKIKAKIPNFRKADQGFDMIETAFEAPI